MADLLKFPYPPDQQAYAVTDGSTVVATALDGGSARYRSDLIDASASVTCQWTFNPSQYQYWKAFIKTGLTSGADPFLIDLYMDSSILTTHEVHLVPGTSMLASQTGQTFVVTATLEVMPNNEDSVLNWEILWLTDLYGDNIPAVLNLLEKIVNIDLADL